MKTCLKRCLEKLKKLRPVSLNSSLWSWEATGEDWELSDDDLVRTLVRHEGEPLLFGRFPIPDVMRDLRDKGLFELLHQRGYYDFKAQAGGLSAFEDRFRLWAKHPQSDEPCLLVDIRTQNGEVKPSCPCCDPSPWKVLIWDWVSFQDPMSEFTPQRPQLPGQEYPGLGIFEDALELMLTYVRRMEVEAVLAVPEYFHNAVLYSELFSFYEGTVQGRFLAFKRDLLPFGLARASKALLAGKVRALQGESEPVYWQPAEQVYPLASRVEKHFSCKSYVSDLEKAQKVRYRFVD